MKEVEMGEVSITFGREEKVNVKRLLGKPSHKWENK
jgi:hypothetical protein